MLVSIDSSSCCNRVDRGEGFRISEKANVEVLEPSIIVVYSISLYILQRRIPTAGGPRSSTSVFFFSFFLHCRSSRCRESRTKYLCNVLNSLHITMALHSKDGQFEILHTCSLLTFDSAFFDDGILPFIRSFSRYNTIVSTSLPQYTIN